MRDKGIGRFAASAWRWRAGVSVALALAVSWTAPVAADPQPCLIDDQFVAPGAGGSALGWASAINGDLAVVGAYYGLVNGISAGNAHVYRLIAGRWRPEAVLAAFDPAYGDYFGASVCISPQRDRILIGATSDVHGQSRGSIYVFRREGGAWVHEAKLVGPESTVYQGLGGSIVTDGVTAIVSAFKNDHGFFNGRVFIYRRHDTQWALDGEIISPAAHAGEVLGQSLALDGDTLLVGAIIQGEPFDAPARAFLFHRVPIAPGLEPTIWQPAGLLAVDGVKGNDGFGISCAMRDGLAIIGAFKDDTDGGHEAGAAYVFRRGDDQQWVQESRLTAAEGFSHDYFGAAVSLGGSTVVIGSHSADASAADCGRAHVFHRGSDGTWTQGPALHPPNLAALDHYGWSVATDGVHAVIGAIDHDVPAGNDGGAFFFAIGGGDCDGDGMLDACTLMLNPGKDLNLNGMPDQCEHPADLNQDGQIDGEDLGILLAQWDLPGGGADLNGDGEIDGLDLGVLLASWTG